MYDYILFSACTLPDQDIRPQVKWAVSLVISDLPQGLCGLTLYHPRGYYRLLFHAPCKKNNYTRY